MLVQLVNKDNNKEIINTDFVERVFEMPLYTRIDMASGKYVCVKEPIEDVWRLLDEGI